MTRPDKPMKAIDVAARTRRVVPPAVLAAISEVVAMTTHEMHGYPGCIVCGAIQTDPPYIVKHGPDCSAETVRNWLNEE